MTLPRSIPMRPPGGRTRMTGARFATPRIVQLWGPNLHPAAGISKLVQTKELSRTSNPVELPDQPRLGARNRSCWKRPAPYSGSLGGSE